MLSYWAIVKFDICGDNVQRYPTTAALSSQQVASSEMFQGQQEDQSGCGVSWLEKHWIIGSIEATSKDKWNCFTGFFLVPSSG